MPNRLALLDFVFHVDVHLATFVRAYGAWVYALLFAIIFIETGVVVMPFLPGDSLLFVVGAMCARRADEPAARDRACSGSRAVLGNQSNYAIGRAIGPRVFWLGALALVQQAGLRPGARVLREATAASRSSPRASCRSCAPSRPSSPASRR